MTTLEKISDELLISAVRAYATELLKTSRSEIEDMAAAYMRVAADRLEELAK